MKRYTALLNVRLPSKQMEQLRKVAEAEEVAMSDIVRELIEARLGEVK